MQFQRAAILCGGQSRRMGADKALLQGANGAYILLQTIENLAQRFGEIVVVRRDHHAPLPFSHPKMMTVTDIPGADGPLCGICSALAGADGHVFVTACDMPYVNLGLITHMQKMLEFEPAPIAVCEAEGFLQPFFAFYHASLFETMLPFVGNTSPTRFIGGQPHTVVPEAISRKYSQGLQMFKNFNDHDAFKASQFLSVAEKTQLDCSV